MQREKQPLRIRRVLVLGGALIILLGLIILIFSLIFRSTSNRPDVESGIAYLKRLEESDEAVIEAQINETRRQERLELLASGQLSVWDQFEDYVVIGDSRAVGFDYHGFLEDDRVLAEGGATIANIAGYMDTLKALDPKEIFLCFGLNDVSIGFWDTPAEYVADFSDILSQLKTEFPDATIYINSTLIARDPAFEKSSKWREIPEYNEAVRTLCAEQGYVYIDNTNLCDTYADLWDIDGIHVQREFYPHWALNMIEAVMRNEENA